MKNLLEIAFVLVFAVSISAQANSPSFTAVAMDGSKVDTAELRGKVVVVNLWFINCINCLEEIKTLNQLVDSYKENKDVVFLALASSKRADLAKFLAKTPFKYTIVPDAQQIILEKFGTPNKNGAIDIAFPMHFVMDKDGKIVIKVQGVKGVEAVKAELKKQFAAKAANG